MYDVLVVGAGPAGLSAALLLGRCRRRVLVFDTGRQRNIRARAAHGFLSRDGIAPGRLLEIAREQLRPYETVAIQPSEVVEAQKRENHFDLTLADGRQYSGRKLLLATGVVDELPEIPGFLGIYGLSAHHCPYCDGWEHRDESIAVYGREGRAIPLAIELLLWSRDIILFNDGPLEADSSVRERLDRLGIIVREEKVVRFEQHDGQLESVVLETGESIPRTCVFFNSGQRLHSELAVQLGCEVSEKGTITTGAFEATNVSGVFVAGDASRSVQMVAVAASEGLEAAVAINTALLKEDLA